MEFLLEENKLLRETLRRIVQRVDDSFVDDPVNESQEYFNTGIFTALSIIEEESGVTIKEILHPKCN